jgi:two-component system copper resistance phosphate regulon response regulator CusR
MKLLVVEDEQKIANSLKRGLEGEGYVVDVSGESSQADHLVSSIDYDLIILDWMIPGPHDGPGLVRKWRGEQNQTPILILTAKTTIGDRVTGLDAGADDFLPKPFAFDELLARVRALLRRPKEHNGNQLKAGKLTIDVAAKSVIKEGKEAHVTAKEFQLLEYLMRHKGEVLSKERLLDHIWSDDSRVQYNTIETFIANLRKKIGKGDEIIQTVRGYGYKIT